MKKNIFFFIGCICLLTCAVNEALAQKDTGTSRQNIIAYADYYLDSVSMQAALFSGKVQLPISSIQESLYLRERGTHISYNMENESYPRPVPTLESYSSGTLVYDGIAYPDVFMRLDLCRDQLAVLSPNRVAGVLLDPSRLSYAELRGYRVIYLHGYTAETQLSPGYYLELYSAGLRVLEKESYDFNPSGNQFVNQSIRYYIVKNGEARRVGRRKGAILRALAEYRRELDLFIRENGIHVRQDMENAIVRIAAEYDRLNK